MCLALSWVACQVQTPGVSPEEQRKDWIGQSGIFTISIFKDACFYLSRQAVVGDSVCARDDRYTVFSSRRFTGQLSL